MAVGTLRRCRRTGEAALMAVVRTRFPNMMFRETRLSETANIKGK
jgi:hypothetical protein